MPATFGADVSALVEDASYVEKVLDAELVSSTYLSLREGIRTDSQARTVLLDDISSSSIFFFLDPQYDSHEATSMIDQKKIQQFSRSHASTGFAG